eukprot:Nk52_evm12s2579 gene=Nk52_evmTU12s2579
MSASRRNHCTPEEAQRLFLVGEPLRLSEAGKAGGGNREELTFEDKVLCGKGYHNFIDVKELRLREAWTDENPDMIEEKKRRLFRRPDRNAIMGGEPLLNGELYENNWYLKKVSLQPKLKSIGKAKEIKSPERQEMEKRIKELCKPPPFKSKYEDQLRELRMQEVRLLEQKRLQVFEGIRGPAPKWYELKNTGFTDELIRNNVIQANTKYWQTLVDVSSDLLSSPVDS